MSASADSGDQLWAKRYRGKGPGYAEAMATSPDGATVFVTGRSSGTTGTYDYVTIAYNAADGSRLWTRRYDGPGGGHDGADAVAVSPDGAAVFVTGASHGSSSSGLDYATIAYDAADGSKLWLRRFDGSAGDDDYASAVTARSDGASVFVTGSAPDVSGERFATIAYDAVTGAKLWSRRYGTRAVPVAMVLSPDASRVVVTGTERGSGSADFATVAYDAATGAKLWIKRYDGPSGGSDWVTAAGESPDGGRIFVTGGSYASTGATDFTTIAYDAATGSKLWGTRYRGPGDEYDYPSGLVVSPDGTKVFVAGSDWGLVEYDYAVIAYDALTGAQVWEERHDGPGGGYDFASSIAASPSGRRVYVTGGSRDDGPGVDHDYETVAFRARSGIPLWTRSYDHVGESDFATTVVVAPDSAAVYVTGYSTGAGGGFEYATIAYAA